MFLDPLGVFGMVGSVDHQQNVLGVHFVDQQIVYSGAVLIAHGGVFHLAVYHVLALVGHQHLHVGHGVFAAQGHLRHVGDVEQAGFFTHGHMLGDHACLVLHRQRVACKRHHFALGG